jgi:hypothetical protein
MDINVLTKSSKQLVKIFNKNSPTILTAMGVAGMITTVVLAIKATPKAILIVEREKEFRYDEYGETAINLEPLDIFELTWKLYLPTAGMGLFTIACMIGSNSIHLRRNAALASLFSVAESTLKEYQAKVVETIGDKKEEKIRGEIAQDKLDKNPVDEKSVILTGKGNYLCYDAFSGRYFRSDVERLRKEENLFNQKLIREGWLNINEFYYEIGLESIELGDEMGWIAERALLELKFSTKLAKGNEPCLVMDYTVRPYHI